MRIAFRVDASIQIGTGHFMRCLTLAVELKKKGAKIIFISRYLPGYLSSLLTQRDIEYTLLPAGEVSQVSIDLAHANWLGTTQANDAKQTIQALANLFCNLIVVDHYALDVRWEIEVRKCCNKLMVIDDLADRHHDCDVLLDQNYYAEMQIRYTSKVSKNCQLLLGPRYSLLREEFSLLREQIKLHNAEVKKILVFFGGIDADNYTEFTINALADLNINQQVDVVIGVDHPNCGRIQQACDDYGYVCHVQTPRIAELMAEADLAIGAGGTAIWERCCLGLPTITFCLALNQQKQIADAADLGLLYAPNKSDRDLTEIVKIHVKGLLDNSALRKLISQNGMNFVNSRGAQKVASALLSLFIEINRAVKSDSRKIFEWRNNFKIRQISRNSKAISWNLHQNWFDEILANENRELVLGSLEGNTVGVVRFDIKNDIAEVSIYLVPDGSFHGYGRSLLLNAEQWLIRNRPEVKMFSATVLKDNQISKNLFLSLNYYLNSNAYYKII